MTGLLSERARDAFAAVQVDEVTAETVISRVVDQSSQLHEVLEEIQSLGLRVVSVQQVAP